MFVSSVRNCVPCSHRTTSHYEGSNISTLFESPARDFNRRPRSGQAFLCSRLTFFGKGYKLDLRATVAYRAGRNTERAAFLPEIVRALLRPSAMGLNCRPAISDRLGRSY
ncbi:Hypothetical protein NTJ_08089 [Nesidiocoris tenuis]|uniref:Uncharacterized protein n=1 Tax=Nesidiocoris tenuis TaxID=355587 RepID=A0ABN7AVF3_9HEMI|nr:Hypothetical protein NTJ_08089 [Nesidiocoris tenuis]